MKHKKFLSSFTLAAALLAAGAMNHEVQANEKPVDGKEKLSHNHHLKNRLQMRKRKLRKLKRLQMKKLQKKRRLKRTQPRLIKKVAETKEAINIAKNADAIIEEESKVASEKSAEKTEADKALANAESTATAAQSAETAAKEASQSANEKRDAKAAEVKAKQAELDGMTDESLKNQISNTEKEVKKGRAVSSRTD